MRCTCKHARRMSKMVQIRSVPDALHRQLKVRAARSGLSLSDYLLRELKAIAAKPTSDELLARIAARGSTSPRTPVADAVRAEREAR